MKNDNETTPNQQDARFLRLITKADSGMYSIQDYYMDSTPKLVARSAINEVFFVPGAQGVCYEYYSNGKRKSVKTYRDGKLEGDATEYYPNGALYKVEAYKNDVAYLKSCYDSNGKAITENGTGNWLTYDDSFKVTEEGPVINGLKEGTWKTYMKSGMVVKSVFTKGIYDLTRQVTEAAKNPANPESVPSFKGGQASLDKYLNNVLIYPTMASSLHIQGRVTVSFIVEEDGKITDVKLLNGVHPTLDNKTLKTVKNMPLWMPAKVDGKPVKMETRLSVNFFIMEKPLTSRNMYQWSPNTSD
jgi:TonB family protein